MNAMMADQDRILAGSKTVDGRQTAQRVEALSRLSRAVSVQILYAFGSRGREALEWLQGIRGSLAPGSSDLDIGVKPASGGRLSVHQKVWFALSLEDLFGVSRVDLVVLTEVDPFLAANIIRGERLYAEDDYLADEYDLYVLRRAGDCIPLERERMALILESKP